MPEERTKVKALRFAPGVLADWVDDAAAQQQGVEDGAGNRSEFVRAAAVKLAKRIVKGSLTSDSFLSEYHQSRAKQISSLVLYPQVESNGRRRELTEVLQTLTSFDAKYISELISEAPAPLIDNPSQKDVTRFRKALKNLATVKVAKASDGIRTNVVLPMSEIDLLEEAARRTHHKLSPFLTWASLLEARRVLGPFDYDEYLDESEDDSSFTVISRFPNALLEKVDKADKVRSLVAEDALTRFLKMIEAGDVSKALLPPDHTVDGGRTMVSISLDPELRAPTLSAAGRLHHTTTGLIAWALFFHVYS